ncbi:ATP-grasp domain-containing protein [Nocardia sp. NPDC051570]|uniref:ATP-grasp domain-containing protein n=1 Tax=Nocardia sp. NPDC051570 TaxID=3364324 RepID=UPI0037AA89D5
MSASPLVVIVDSYAPTAVLVREFHKAGAALVRVQSTPEVPRFYRAPFDLDYYVDNIVHDGDFAETARRVAAHDPMAIVAGGEIGVEFADTLAAELGLPGNGVELSSARRDKYIMIETIKRAGVAGARQKRIDSEAELVDWHESIGGRIVVKPLRSGAGDSVFFCDTPAESATAFAKIVNYQNVYSQLNIGAVAQEYLRGTEYMVNTVSRDGRHRVCEIWRTARISANGVMDLSETAYLMPRRGPVQDRIAAYTFEVLDALGIAYGPAHVEVKMTADGPMLVEAGARISGANLPHYAQVAHGRSQLDWAVEAYLNPDRYLASYQDDFDEPSFCAFVGLISPVSGVLRGYRHLDALRELESFHEMRVFVQTGGSIVPTVDDVTYPAAVILMHESEETVLRDAGTIRYLDGPDFYDLLP